jgi:hypothetical protein
MDFQTLLVIVVIGVLLIYLLKRGQSGGVKPNVNAQSQGTEHPRYDDPNVEGQGSFGRDSSNQSASESRNSNSSGTERPRHDDPNVEGHGGFGRDRTNENSADASRSRTVDELAEQRARAIASREENSRNDRDDRDDRNDRNDRDDRDSQSLAADRLRQINRDKDESRSSSSHDDPNVEGHGGFGRDKD